MGLIFIAVAWGIVACEVTEQIPSLKWLNQKFFPIVSILTGFVVGLVVGKNSLEVIDSAIAALFGAIFWVGFKLIHKRDDP